MISSSWILVFWRFLSPSDDFNDFGYFQSVTVRTHISIFRYSYRMILEAVIWILFFFTLRRFQRFWLFSNCHCKNMHADMSISKISACRGISLDFKCTFRISDFKNVVDKTSSGNKSLFSSFERFCLPATISTILVIFKLSL